MRVPLNDERWERSRGRGGPREGRAPWLRTTEACLLIGACLLAGLPARGQEPRDPGEFAITPAPPPLDPGCVAPDPERLAAEGTPIGRIQVHVGDIFDPSVPGEGARVYRLVNRLHINTRPSVVENLLLFREGDRYDRRLLDETERLLRAQSFFYDAQVTPLQVCDGKVDLLVQVRDVWTLFVSASFSRSGGVNRTRFELTDGNFLGYGKDIGVERRSTVDRTSELVRYRDRSLLGSRARLELWYSDNSDGSFQVFDLRRPFYALDTRRAAALRVRIDDRFDKLYQLGKVRDEFRHQQDFIEGWVGLSPGLKNGSVWRFSLGATYLKDDFSLPRLRPGRAPAPPDRQLVYPWLGFEWLEDDFKTTRNLNQLVRTEDLYLGRRITGQLGYSSTSWGGDENRAVYSLGLEDGFEIADRQLLLTTAYLTGRYGDDGAENVHFGGTAKFYWRNWGRHLFFASVGADLTRDLDPEEQLLLGGDSGLRGYPLRYQQGDRRFLISLEQRFYTRLNLFHTFQLGGAVFVDFGRAWYSLESRNPRVAAGYLRDWGIGLRLGSSRSAGTLVHFDVAFPLDADPSIDKVQWLVTTKETF